MKRMTITGHVGHDPEIHNDGSGHQFASFSIAVDVGSKQNPKTDWIDVTCGEKLAEITMNHIKKGSKLLVEGFPSVNAYINKDNIPIGNLKIRAHLIEFLNYINNSESGSADDKE